MIGTQAAAKAIYAALTGAAAVTALVGTSPPRIFESDIPQGRDFPAVVFNLQSGSDRRAIGSNGRLLSRQSWLVKAVDQSESYAGADALMEALDSALEDAVQTVTVGGASYRVQVIGRLSPIRFSERSENVPYKHVGGVYLVHITEA